MAITINGTGTITGISAGGLPDGSVTAADIESSLDLTGKTVTLPSGTGGKILQVVSDTEDAAVSIPGVAGSGESSALLTCSITPTYANSKMLIFVNAQLSSQYDIIGIRVKKDGSTFGMQGAGSSSRSHITAYDTPKAGNNYMMATMSAHFMETLSGANTSTAISYTMHAQNPDTSPRDMMLNRGSDDTNTSTRGRVISSLTVMEIAP